MSGALTRQAWRMLQAPWQWRRNHHAAWARRLALLALLLLMAGVPAAALVWMPPRLAWTLVGGMVLLGLALVWGLQFSALLRLDHPHTAHAVPGHAQALRATALGLWAAMVALSAGGAALWAAGLPDAAPPHFGPLLGLAMGSGLLALALCLRWWWVWFLLCCAGLVPGLGPVWAAARGAGAWALVHWQAQPGTITLGVLAVQGLLLTRLFGAGDSRHARAYAERERMRQAMAASTTGQQPGLAAFGAFGEWLGRPWQRLGDAWLARLCRRATPRPASVLARAEVVLHGSQHWLKQVATGLLVQAIVALCLALTILLAGVDGALFFAHGQVGLGIGITVMALSAAFGLPGALWHSRREQALLLLLPGMPRGAALNRALARRRLLHCLWLWLTLLPALGSLAGAGLQPRVLGCVVLALPMTAWLLWPDVSRLRPPGTAQVLLPSLACVAGSVLSQWLISRHPGALLPWLLALLGLAAGLLAWRWRGMAAQPQALPAGRLA